MRLRSGCGAWSGVCVGFPENGLARTPSQQVTRRHQQFVVIVKVPHRGGAVQDGVEMAHIFAAELIPR